MIGYPSFCGGVQVPELDMSVSCSDKVAVVLREGDGDDSAGDFVGGDDQTFLLKQRHFYVAVSLWQQDISAKLFLSIRNSS